MGKGIGLCKAGRRFKGVWGLSLVVRFSCGVSPLMMMMMRQSHLIYMDRKDG